MRFLRVATLLLVVSLTGACSNNRPVMKYPFVVPNEVPVVEIRVATPDVSLYTVYIQALRARSDELVRQIKDYNSK